MFKNNMQISLVTFILLILVSSIGAQSNLIATAIQSGDFNSASTWVNGVRPNTNCTVIIPQNTTVFISYQTDVTVRIESIRIYGKLQIGSPNVSSPTESFSFEYPVNFMVFDGGILEDLTTNHIWSLMPNSIMTIFRNASFRSSQAKQVLSIINNSTILLNATVNGPFTLTTDLQGMIQLYSSITYVPSQSGDFGLNLTWLGGLAPSIDRCSPTFGGCVLLIPRGYNVTRRNNQSTINAVDVHIYGGFEISSWENYLFLYPINFYIYNGGIFQDSTEKGCRFSINTSIIVNPGGFFVTRPSNSISSYRERNNTLSTLQLNKTYIAGPYKITIGYNGIIDNNGSSLLTTTRPSRTITTEMNRSDKTLTCYSCEDCDDSFKPNNVQTIQVPANQGYYCRKSSVLNVIDRDADQWCSEGNVKGNGLWCCQTNLCNSAENINLMNSFLLLICIYSFISCQLS